MDETEKLSSHQWQFSDNRWTCARCGHSFEWAGRNSQIPTKFASDGSPARDDPCWFKFHVVGTMSFLNAFDYMPERKQAALKELSGEPSKGLMAICFKHCLFEQQAEDLLIVGETMES